MTDDQARIERSGERLVGANGIEHCVECFGDSGEPALLLIANTMLDWPSELCEALAAQGRAVIRYDLRDTGRSTRLDPLDPGHSLRDLASDAAGLLAAVGIERADVAGFGSGGWIAQILALDHPERVRSLTLVAARAVAPGSVDDDLPDHDPDFMRELMRASPPEDWTDRDAVVDHLTRGALLMAGSETSEAEARRSVAAVYERTEASLRPGLDRGSMHLSDQLAYGFSKLDCKPRWRERLGEIDVPALVVHGTEDPFFPLGNGEALAREIRGADLLALDGVGNALPARSHERFCGAMLTLRNR